MPARASNLSAAVAQRLGGDWAVMAGLSRTDAHEAELRNARNDGGAWGCPCNVDLGATPCGALNPMDIAATPLLGKAVWDPGSAHRLEFSLDHLERSAGVRYGHTLGPACSTVTGLPTGEVIHRFDRRMDLHRSRFAVAHLWKAETGWVDEVKTTLAYRPNGYARSGEKWATSPAGDQVITRDYLDFDEDFLELDIQATSRFTTALADHVVTWGFDGDRTKTDYTRLDVVRNLTTGVVTETPAGGFNFANADTRRADIHVQDRITLLDGALELTPGLRFATYRIDPRPNADYKPVPGSEPRARG